jgi:hypothetical protein
MSSVIGSRTGRKQINLYQATFRPPQIVLPTQSLLLGVAVFAAGLLLLHAWDSWKFSLYRQDVDRMTAQSERMVQQLEQTARSGPQADPQVETEASALEARVRALQRAQEAIASGALGSASGYSAQFLGLSKATVPGAWLTRIEVSGQGREMNLEGRALQGEDPARLIAALGHQPLFVGLSYAALDVHPPEEEKPGQADGNGKTGKDMDFLEFFLSAHLPEGKAPALKSGAARESGGAS